LGNKTFKTMEKKNLAKKMLLVGAMASGLTFAQSYFNEAQATGGPGGIYSYRDCQLPHGKAGGSCVKAYGSCVSKVSCG